MLAIAIVLGLYGVTVTAIPAVQQRIVGGDLTTIESYPEMVVMLSSLDGSVFMQECGGSILNTRSILTAAHCSLFLPRPEQWRARVGSSYAHSGGVVHILTQIIIHPEFNSTITDADIAIARTASAISYNSAVKPALIAGVNYNLRDNEEVWAAGWGRIETFGPRSEQLRHVQIWTINQDICRSRYGYLTENMLCSGVLDVGGRDQCYGDSGGPLFHKGVVVGVCSFGVICAHRNWPGVNARVSRFTPWIQANA